MKCVVKKSRAIERKNLFDADPYIRDQIRP